MPDQPVPAAVVLGEGNGGPQAPDPRIVIGEAQLEEMRPRLASLTGRTLQTQLARLLEANLVWNPTGELANLDQRVQMLKGAAEHVRSLVVDLADDCQANAVGTIHTLKLTTQPDPMLPNLESLRMIITHADHLNGALALLQKNLHDLSIHCNQDENSEAHGWSFVFALLFRELRSTWNADLDHITSLELLRLPRLALIPDVVQAIPALTKFRGDLSTLTSAFMTSLAASPNLQEYTLQELHPFHGHTLSDEYIRTCFLGCHFSALTKVILLCNLRIVAAMLSSINSPLEELTIRCDSHIPNGLIPGHAVWLRSLRKVDIHLSERMCLSAFYEDVRVDALPWRIFSPLLHCSRMSTFSFQYESLRPLAFDDADLSHIARSWPEAESVKFKWSKQQFQGAQVGGLEREEALTMVSLPQFARHCPQLQYLELSSFNGLMPVLGDVRPSQNRFTLDVGRALVRGVRATAVLLYRLWPSIEIISSYDGRHVLAWQSVRDHIALLRCSVALSRDPGLLEAGASDDILETIRAIAARQ